MALTAMISMNACSRINDNIAKEVCDALEIKYGEEFKVLKIGDRLNTNHTKLYVYPVDNEDIVFTAIIDRDTREVEDDYVVEKVNCQVEKEVNKAFELYDIKVFSSSYIIDKNEIITKSNNYTPRELYEDNAFDHYSIHLIIEGSKCDAIKIQEAIKKANLKIGVNLLIHIYVFDEENYYDCLQEFIDLPKVNSSIVNQHSPYSVFDVRIRDGQIDLSNAEIEVELGVGE